jgi:hypothetical protein
MDDSQGLVAVFDCVQDDPEGDYVINLLELQVLGFHLFVDAVKMFGAAADLSHQAVGG